LCSALAIAGIFPVSGAPHSPQNLNPGGFSKPHFAQIFLSGIAQAPQNFMPWGFSEPQLGRCMEVTLFKIGDSIFKRL
jgi:hypothetical protein